MAKTTGKGSKFFIGDFDEELTLADKLSDTTTIGAMGSELEMLDASDLDTPDGEKDYVDGDETHEDLEIEFYINSKEEGIETTLEKVRAIYASRKKIKGGVTSVKNPSANLGFVGKLKKWGIGDRTAGDFMTGTDTIQIFKYTDFEEPTA